MRQERLDLGRAHFPGVTFIVKKNEPTNPVGVALLGSDTVMARPNRIAKLVEEFFWGFLFLSIRGGGV